MGAFGTLGYILDAASLATFMPGFGELPSDQWRSQLLFDAIPVVVSLLLSLLLSESPVFCAVKGRAQKCERALANIARMNKRSLLDQVVHTPNGCTSGKVKSLGGLLKAIGAVAWGRAFLFTCLICMEATKSYMLSGTSYLWPQLFQMSPQGILSPQNMYILASLAP